MNITAKDFAFFKAAGVFRVKAADKARERFDDALTDFERIMDAEEADDLFAALLEKDKADKLAKIEADAARMEAREAREAAKAALPVVGGADSATDHIERRGAGRYVLTVAQNNTEVDADFLASLLVYCERNNAELLIARTTYNKKGFAQPDIDGDDKTYYVDAVKPYLVDGQIDLNGAFHFMADANVIVTAKWPTSGFDGATPAGCGVIVPASKIELRVSAALKNAPTKIVAATGAVTKRNYILRKTGALAAIRHNIGAVFVDTETRDIRHLEQMEDASGFYDLDGFYSPNGYREPLADDVAALQFGDIHAEKMETANLRNAIRLIERLEPENILFHDVLDFSSRNHHNIKDPHFIHAQFVAGNTVKRDLQKVAGVIDDFADAIRDYGSTLHVIESNHDLAINTWLKTADISHDPANALVYYRCKVALFEHVEEGEGGPFNMLKYAYEAIGNGCNGHIIDFHETDESVIIAGVEMGNHGHNGVNGSRGSPKQFAELGVKMNTGHTHSPSIYGGVYTAGVTASLNMDYNKGASSWAIAHLVTYANGQRQIIFA